MSMLCNSSVLGDGTSPVMAGHTSTPSSPSTAVALPPAKFNSVGNQSETWKSSRDTGGALAGSSGECTNPTALKPPSHNDAFFPLSGLCACGRAGGRAGGISMQYVCKHDTYIAGYRGGGVDRRAFSLTSCSHHLMARRHCLLKRWSRCSRTAHCPPVLALQSLRLGPLVQP